MTPADAQYLTELVARRIGLPTSATVTAADRLLLTPSEIHENDGFSIEVRTSWRTADVRFLPGKFARPLIEKMGEAGEEARVAFSALAAAAAKQGRLTVRVNGADLDAQKSPSWPSRWERLELGLKKQGVVFEELTQSELQQLLGDIIAPVFGM